MFDIGWTELLLIGIVALIVVGPKDLPRMFAALGRFTAKARAMGREFQRAMDDAARESGVREASAEMKAMVSKKGLGIDKLESAARKFESWDPMKPERKAPPTVAAPGSETAKLAERRAADAEARRAAAVPPPDAAAKPTAGAKTAAPGRKAASRPAKAAPQAAATTTAAPKAAAPKAAATKVAAPKPAAAKPAANPPKAPRPARKAGPGADGT